jgi:hypothetical protein
LFSRSLIRHTVGFQQSSIADPSTSLAQSGRFAGTGADPSVPPGMTPKSDQSSAFDETTFVPPSVFVPDTTSAFQHSLIANQSDRLARSERFIQTRAAVPSIPFDISPKFPGRSAREVTAFYPIIIF